MSEETERRPDAGGRHGRTPGTGSAQGGYGAGGGRSQVDGEAKGGASGARAQVNAGAAKAGAAGGANGLGPRASLLMSLALGLLLAALSGLVMFPAAEHLRSLRDGERAQATLHTSGSCMAGQCEVEFEADGRTVVADLPVGSGGGKRSVGAAMAIRYQADDPRVVAREDDVGGGGAALLAWMSGGAAVFFLAIAGAAALHLARQRRTRNR
ncbi:hypothetical protein SGR_4342 [Streptomyces griseus subsp. griseus NBRC 13350]|uniref:Uncharacterized protein n=2 Tax=Streptomyces TaxID=1883 RepID=B1VTT1_STRGG|nr:hypothetical protein SGR_4342 [Streptomyces griseus subsp. griseus NBRC 13350]